VWDLHFVALVVKILAEFFAILFFVVAGVVMMRIIVLVCFWSFVFVSCS